MPEFETVIGLEIHVQLNTKSKMFCRCDNFADGKKPNTVVCPRCLGMPGTLPVINREAVIKTIQTGLVFNCQINKSSKFDRKHYFYPDLPKGYQISQYDMPFCKGGEIEIRNPRPEADQPMAEKIKKIRLNRIHLEEDAGKLTHPVNQPISYVDLNRASTPLMEIVTEPDIGSPEEAKTFMKLIQLELINQGVSDADMEKGHLRCDANISIKIEDRSKKLEENQMSEIVEIKNLNSFRFVEKALRFEEERLRSEYPNWPKKRTKITRGFDSAKGITYEQRRKEEAADYRYFPEPDLPPITADKLISIAKGRVKNKIQEKIDSLTKLTGLTEEESLALLGNKELASTLLPKINEPYFKELVNLVVQNQEFIKNINLVIDYAKAIKNGEISPSLAKQKINNNQPLSMQVTVGEDQIIAVIKKIIGQNQDAVKKYQNGKIQLLGFFVGLVVKEFRGNVEPKKINQLILEELKND